MRDWLRTGEVLLGVSVRAAWLMCVGVVVFASAVALGAFAAYLVRPSDGSGGVGRVLRLVTPSRDGAPAVPEVASGQPGRSEAVFAHPATPDNIVDNSTYLDLPLADGEPEAVLLIVGTRGPEDTSTYAHEIGVWYDRNRSGRWAVFNQDLAPMQVGAEFDVVILEGADKLVHRAEPNNTEAERTYIDDPLTNGNPSATLSITQNWNPGGVAGTYNDHPVGVRYDDERGMWVIYNEDLAAMPEGAAFNVEVSEGGQSTEGTATP